MPVFSSVKCCFIMSSYLSILLFFERFPRSWVCVFDAEIGSCVAQIYRPSLLYGFRHGQHKSFLSPSSLTSFLLRTYGSRGYTTFSKCVTHYDTFSTSAVKMSWALRGVQVASGDLCRHQSAEVPTKPADETERLFERPPAPSQYLI